jgi:hypothetical protein
LIREGDTLTLHDLQFGYAREALGTEGLAKAHGRFVHALLEAWGGLELQLPATASRLFGQNQIDRYGLAHLVEHLAAAGDEDTIHALLAMEGVFFTASGGRATGNLWFTVHERSADIATYLRDVRTARRLAEEATDRSLTRGETAHGIGLEIRYALMLGSMVSIAGNIPPWLLPALVQTASGRMRWPTGSCRAEEGRPRRAAVRRDRRPAYPSRRARGKVVLARPRPGVLRDEMSAPGAQVPPVGRRGADHTDLRPARPPARRAPDTALLRRALFGWAFNPATRQVDPPPTVAKALAWVAAASLPVAALEDLGRVRGPGRLRLRRLDGRPAAAITRQAQARGVPSRLWLRRRTRPADREPGRPAAVEDPGDR